MSKKVYSQKGPIRRTSFSDIKPCPDFIFQLISTKIGKKLAYTIGYSILKGFFHICLNKNFANTCIRKKNYAFFKNGLYLIATNCKISSITLNYDNNIKFSRYLTSNKSYEQKRGPE